MVHHPIHRRHTELPKIPTPQPHEMPVVEQLTHADAPTHERQKMVKPFEVTPEARFNRLYGSLRVDGSWQNVVDNYAKGGITTIQSTLVQSSVTLALSNPETRLSRWPGAVQMYLVLRSFSIAPTTASFAVLGSLDLYYQDLIGGQTIPLGSIVQNDEVNLQNCNILIPTPITDPGALANPVGNIQATLSGAGTIGTYIWQIAFSYAYLLPAVKGYEIQHIQDLMDGHYGTTDTHNQHNR